MLSPIQTRRHWLSRLVFEPREEAVEKSEYRGDISLKHESRGDCWHVRLGVRFGAQPPNEGTFRCDVVFEGLFAVHPEFPPEKANDLVRMNGGAILYGAAREMILNLTARSKHGPFELPTIDARMFLKIPEEAVTQAADASRLKE